jgi:hypothetical protein
MWQKLRQPKENEAKQLYQNAKKRVKKITDKMEKICIAPGEYGTFQNWGDDIFIEEKCFPHLFPFGIGGYLSTALEGKDHDMGFANYVRHRVMSADRKYRQDYIYLFFLLLVKELIALKRCKETFLRQATKVSKITKEDVINVGHEHLVRYNRTFEVFKTMRGTSSYYQQSKKNLMAMLRQKGCPTLFVTLSCAEYKWKELVRQILETEWNQQVSMDYVDKLSDGERSKIITENAVQSTVHFQKRIEKIFNLFKYDDIFEGFHVSDFYYRIEFQARGAPHIHTLLWLRDETGKEAPSFWSTNDLTDSKIPDDLKQMLKEKINISTPGKDTRHPNEELDRRKEEISILARTLVFGSIDDAKCRVHRQTNICPEDSCSDCQLIKERVEMFNTHGCTFSCKKKKRTLIIRENEGHGRLAGKLTGESILSIFCRYNYPHNPIDETLFLLGLPKDLPEEELARRKKDYKKIRK